MYEVTYHKIVIIRQYVTTDRYGTKLQIRNYKTLSVLRLSFQVRHAWNIQCVPVTRLNKNK
jgi:hypothetical protein